MESTNAFLVVGANGAVGAAVSRSLRAAGHNVVLAGRNESELSELGQDLDAPVKILNACVIDEMETAAVEAADMFGSLDGIVNCVGSVLLKPAHLTSIDEWRETIETNLTTAFASVRAAHKAMKKSGGAVVLMSSAAARTGLANHEAIAAAKAGVVGLMRSAAASYASRGLRFNAIAPGLVKSNMTRNIWDNEKSADFSRRMHPLGRLGEPADVAGLICWLLNPNNCWVTGQVFGVDGGLATLRVAAR